MFPNSADKLGGIIAAVQIFVVDITVAQKRHRHGPAKGTGPLDTGESGCSNHPRKDRCQHVDTGGPLTLCPNRDSGEQKWHWPGDTLGLRDVLDVHPDISRVLKVERMSLYRTLLIPVLTVSAGHGDSGTGVYQAARVCRCLVVGCCLF